MNIFFTGEENNFQQPDIPSGDAQVEKVSSGKEVSNISLQIYDKIPKNND